MSAQVTNYQCPACTAPLHFVGASGQLECEYCGSKYPVREIEALYAEKNQAAAEAKTDAHAQAMYDDQWGEDAKHMRAYSCPSCGAELICDETTAATSCPYCNNPTIIPGQFTGVRRPDYVIPFKLGKEEAIAALKQHCKGKPLLPKAFTARKHIQEIKGVYVPFWLFDGKAYADMDFAASRSTSYVSGDRETITTHHYRVRRAGTVDFVRVPADGSSMMPDDYMDAIEPYDYSELKPFAMAYLPGYLADRYDVTAEQAYERVVQRMEFSAEQEISADVVGYETSMTLSSDVKVTQKKVEYVLLPVWMLNTKYKGKDYLFAMNGQTGKLIGELPISMKRFWAWFAGIAAGSAAALTALLAMLML